MTYILNSAPPWFVNALRKMGMEPDRLAAAAEAGIDQHIFKGSFEAYLAVLNEAEHFYGIPEVGLQLGSEVDERQLGIYGYIKLNASSIRELLMSTVRYFAAHASHAAYRLSHGEHTSRLEYDVLLSSKQSPKQDIALSLSHNVHLLRKHLGPEWTPVSCCFQFSQPDDLSEYYRRFGRRILFNQSTNFIEIDNAELDTGINNTDPQLLQIIKQQAESVIAQSRDSERLTDYVRAQLMNTLGTPDAAQEAIAASLHISCSTLRRRLGEEGKTFRQLRNEIIYQLATEALSKTSSSISQIAFKLGYAEVSAFNHAFLKLSGGLSPQAYRQHRSRGV